MRGLLRSAPRLARRFVAQSGAIVPLINHMGVSRPNRSALRASGSVNTGTAHGRMYVAPTFTVLSHCGVKVSFALQDFGALRARACRYNDVTDEERLRVCPARRLPEKIGVDAVHRKFISLMIKLLRAAIAAAPKNFCSPPNR